MRDERSTVSSVFTLFRDFLYSMDNLYRFRDIKYFLEVKHSFSLKRLVLFEFSSYQDFLIATSNQRRIYFLYFLFAPVHMPFVFIPLFFLCKIALLKEIKQLVVRL